ncbi:carbon starvation CstA family protein [Anaerococcus sp. AGMB09787]|uniref:carbon starvation CstA family protein n=1 Tax=Anaerococcus sp. AGMB09787 TaxID=2922869 RepID=UPI001FAFFBB7|nr:carbon starvation CstA family protein [Anaerococcus sp. AGMB09787]
MILFIIGILILLIGGYFYGKYCEKVFGPDDRETPAVKKADGVDFVVMKSWKNQLVELLNIAGTGPIFGPIQGILFGPIAFITIPVGCVLAGSLHDYFAGMISMRNDGGQVPKLIEKYVGSGTKKIYFVVTCVLMLLVGAVFIYTPGDLIVNDIMGMDINSGIIWFVYAGILLYYIVATIFPIDAIIGKIYPIFGAFLIISAIGIFVGVLANGGRDLHAMTEGAFLSVHPDGLSFIPVFFITVACGILSGFHATQATMISRTVKSEKDGVKTFYNMMIVEGFIAMCWAAGAMILFNQGSDLKTPTTIMVSEVARHFMGDFGGLIAIIGVIVLPITSGDTAFRSLRLMLSEQFNIDQSKITKRIGLSAVLFIPAVAILYWAKINPSGFNILWRYFAFTNQLVAVFGLIMISIYLGTHGKNYWISLIPGMFYAFVVSSFILHADIGFKLDKLFGIEGYTVSYIVAAIIVIFICIFVRKKIKERESYIRELDFIDFQTAN